MNADALLQHAAAVVRDRRRLYGEPFDLFEQVATRWSLVIGAKVTPAQAMLCLIDLKLVRLTHDARHLDSVTDIAGYASCLTEALSDASAT